MLRYCFSILIIISLLYIAADAREISVQPPYFSAVSTALADTTLQSGDVIIMSPGTYSSCSKPAIFSSKNITIRGYGAALSCAQYVMMVMTYYH